jgi:hypothetical protein
MPDPLIGKPAKVEMGKLKSPKAAGEQMLNSVQIIEKSVKNERPDMDVNKFMQTLANMIQRKMVQLLQIGNTVFMLRPKGDGSVEFHTFTVESPQDLVKRYKAGLNSLKQMGFKKAYSYANSPAFVKISEQTGLPVRVTQSQMMMGDKMVPAYKFEVDI